ncbi:MAG: hypothetical protein AAFR61_22995 [Bacteroidota bacterium]
MNSIAALSLRHLPLVLLTGLMFSLQSCKSDACEVDCGDHGICAEEACQCEPGYELATDGSCNLRTAERLAGVYQAATTGCNTGAYSMSVQASNVDDEIMLLTNFGSYLCANGEPITMEVEITDSENFVLEPGPYCGQYNISGTGKISGNTLTITYIAEYESPLGSGTQVKDECVVTLTK